jgi:cytochrome b involved in lipid metabolism
MYANMLLHPVLLQVYNVTRFLEEHPGGDDVLLSATGTRYSEECHFDISSN